MPNHIYDPNETIQLALGKKRMMEGLAHLSGSEGRVNTVVRVSSRWFEEDTVTDRHQTGPRSLLFRRFSSSRGIHSRWLPKNTSRETNTATAILRRRTNSWTDHAQKQRVCKLYESWIAFASSTVLFRNKKENGKGVGVRISHLFHIVTLSFTLESPSQVVRFIFFFLIIKNIQVLLVKIDRLN